MLVVGFVARYDCERREQLERQKEAATQRPLLRIPEVAEALGKGAYKDLRVDCSRSIPDQTGWSCGTSVRDGTPEMGGGAEQSEAFGLRGANNTRMKDTISVQMHGTE
jgi:hypothetical protein